MKNEQIINIIAPNIKTGGGKELLEYLLEYIEENYKNLKVVVYLDTLLSHIKETNNREVNIMPTTLSKILLFTKKTSNSLYFGNLPPIKKSKNSAVYFHNPYLLLSKKELFKKPKKLFIKYYLQQIYINIFKNNISTFACQTSNIKRLFALKYKYNALELLPFFRLCPCNTPKQTKVYDFCYISLAHPHKNHNLLFNALKIISEKGISLKIAVTIESDKIELINKINSINQIGNVIIENLGVISKSNVCNVYSKSNCLIFPSTEETFGLGLIEAVKMGLNVIAADLDYVYEVIEPSLVFNPNCKDSCANAIETYITNKDIKKSVAIIENKIDNLIYKFIKE